MDGFEESLAAFALNNKNYKGWRKEHTKVFGKIFSSAFEGNPEAQIQLTAALINISQRAFEDAMPKLTELESICANEFDRTVVNYFKGLDYEMLANEEEMVSYYEKVKESTISFDFPLPFHPYYRTAKFAQRDSECSKAVYYYRKALSFYDGIVPSDHAKPIVSQIIYDIATIYLFMHQYDDCERFLSISEQYDPSVNQQRNYVKAILYATQKRFEESWALSENMNRFLKEYLDPMLMAIENGSDLHYCASTQDRSGYADFWNAMETQKQQMEELLANGKNTDAEAIISEKLSNALAFAKRLLECRIEKNGALITVYCKNHSAKTVKSEYEFLFSSKPKSFENWTFISVDWFEEY